jgi:hypothetical protein
MVNYLSIQTENSKHNHQDECLHSTDLLQINAAYFRRVYETNFKDRQAAASENTTAVLAVPIKRTGK